MSLTTMYNHAGLPALSDYYQAKQLYDNVVHIRGRSKETKPLGRERRYDQYLIEKRMIANQAENVTHIDYVCSLWGDPVITFKQDGRIVLNPRWHSVPTRCVMHYVLREHGVVDSIKGKWYFVNKLKQAFLLEGGITLKFDTDGVLKGEMKQEYAHKVKRKSLNELRQRYKFFTDYAYTMLSLDPITSRLEVAEACHGLDFKMTPTFVGQPNYWSINNRRNTPDENRLKLFEALDRPNACDDASLLYELATCVAYSVGTYDYKLSKSVCYPHMFIRFFDELLKYQFYKDVFERIEQPLGSLFSDRNAKYIKQ